MTRFLALLFLLTLPGCRTTANVVATVHVPEGDVAVSVAIEGAKR